MFRRSATVTIVSLVILIGTPAFADVIYNNLTPNNSMATAVRPDTAPFEIEAGDDFVLGAPSRINSASFVGLLVPGGGGTPSISQVVVEIYRVFPADSDTARTTFPTPPFSTPQVPARQNSPSDIAFASRDSASNQLTFTSQQISATFMALNSIAPGGIHPIPGQTTGGNGPLTGQEVQINVSFATPFDLPADHYFFVPQVLLTNGGQFYWLSASRPITGAGTTPFAPDLQTWTRDEISDRTRTRLNS